MKRNVRTLTLMLILATLLTACDNGPSPQPATPQSTALPTTPPAPQATQQTTQTTAAGSPTIVDSLPITTQPTAVENNPSPTAVTATATGAEMTALQALALLKPKALAWQQDVRLAILANTRPGQQSALLGSALGNPNVFEATPGGRGRNWTLVAVSPSRGALAVSADGAQVDLSAAGVVSSEMLGGFSSPNLSKLDLSTLNLSGLLDSDKVVASTPGTQVGTALFAPEGLGLGPLPTPTSGGTSPSLAYQTFSTDPAQQNFVIFDDSTGAVILDSTKP